MQRVGRFIRRLSQAEKTSGSPPLTDACPLLVLKATKVGHNWVFGGQLPLRPKDLANIHSTKKNFVSFYCAQQVVANDSNFRTFFADF